MSEIILRNTTPQVQELTVRESNTRRFHVVQVIGRGQIDLDRHQVTPDVRRKVSRGVFKAYDEKGQKIEFDQLPSEEKTPETPEALSKTHSVENPQIETVSKTHSVDEPEGEVEEKKEEEFKCEECGESFGSSRSLSAHKRSHK